MPALDASKIFNSAATLDETSRQIRSFSTALQYTLPDKVEDERDAALQLAVEASRHSRGYEDVRGTSADPVTGGTKVLGEAPDGIDVAVPSSPKNLNNCL